MKCLIEINYLMGQMLKENIFKEDDNKTDETPKILACNIYK